MQKNWNVMIFKSIVIMSVLMLTMLSSTGALALESAQAQEQELEVEIRLVSETDSPDQIVNTIVFPDFSFNQVTKASNNGASKLNWG